MRAAPVLAAPPLPARALPALSWRGALLLLLAAGMLNGLFWMANKKERWYEGQDSHEYRLTAHNLLDGHGYTRDAAPPYGPSIYREPGYALFLAAVFAPTGRSDQAVALLQSLLVGASAILAALLGRAVFRDERIALLGGLFVAASPDLGDHARYEMSEAAFTPLFLAALLVAYRGWRHGSIPLGIVAGVLFGAAGYMRVVAFPSALVLVAGSLLLSPRVPAPPDARRRVKWGASVLLVTLLIALPWVARNAAQFGQAAFTGRSGAFLIPRADKAAATPEKQLGWAATAVWAVTYPFSHLVVPAERLHTPPNIWDGPLGDLELLETTRAIGRYCTDQPDLRAVDSCHLQEGQRLILAHPVQYVLLTPLEFVRLTFYVYPSKLSVLRNAVVWAGLATVLTVLLSRSQRTPERLWLLLAIGAYTLPSIAGDTQPRYGVPLVPLYTLFAAAGAVWLAGRFAHYGGASPGAALGRRAAPIAPSLSTPRRTPS